MWTALLIVLAVVVAAMPSPKKEDDVMVSMLISQHLRVFNARSHAG